MAAPTMPPHSTAPTNGEGGGGGGDALLLRVHSPSGAANPAGRSGAHSHHTVNGSDSSGRGSNTAGTNGAEIVDTQRESESAEAAGAGAGGGDGGSSARRKLLPAPPRSTAAAKTGDSAAGGGSTAGGDSSSDDDDGGGEDDADNVSGGGDPSAPFPLTRTRSLHRRNKSSTGSGFGSISSEFGLLEESVDTIRDTLVAVLRFFTFQSTLEPNARFKVVWDWFLIALAVYNWAMVPWYIAIDTELGATLTVTDWIVTCLFLLDILISFRTGYVDYSGNQIFDAKLIAARFASTLLVVDAIAAFPFHIFSPLIHFGPSAQFVDNCLKVNFLLRASKLLNSERIDAFVSPQARISKLLFGFLCLAHFFACLFFFVGTVQEGDDSWLLRQNLLDKPHSQQYITALYWSIATMTTVGYGDVTPVTVYEQATVIPIMLLSALIYANIFGNMAYAMETITSTIRRYQSRIDSVKEFVKVHELPPELQRKLYDYTDAQWSQTKGFETDAMLSHLPVSVKAEIMMYINHTLIERVPLFKQCSDRFLEAMILRMTSQVCLTDDYVFKEGDKSREMYFVRSGTVQIIMEVQGQEQRIAEIGSYSDFPFFGEISSDQTGTHGLLLGETRTASARASTKCVLSKLSQQDFFEVLSMFPEEENSLRETATMRLEQDIEREAKALKKKGNGARPFGSMLHTRQATPLLMPLERPGTFHALHDEADDTAVAAAAAGGSTASDVQMTALTSSIVGSKAENRLRYLEGGNGQLPHGVAPNADLSRSPAATAPAMPLAAAVAAAAAAAHSIDPSLHARSDKLSKIQSASVRQSLFAPHGGTLVGTTGLVGGGLVEGALANMVKRARRSIAQQSTGDPNAAAAATATAPAAAAAPSTVPPIPEASSPSMEASPVPSASPSAPPSRPRSGVNLSVDVGATPFTFSVTVAPPEETAATAAASEPSPTGPIAMPEKRLRAASTGSAIASISEDGVSPLAEGDDLFVALPPPAVSSGGSGSSTPSPGGTHRHKRTTTLDKQALAAALSSGSVNMPRKSSPGLGSPTLSGQTTAIAALAELRLRRNDPLASLHARSRTALFGGSAMARVVEQAMARAKAHRLPHLSPTAPTLGNVPGWEQLPTLPATAAAAHSGSLRSPSASPPPALPPPTLRESQLEDKVRRLELQLAALANQVSSLLAAQGQTPTKQTKAAR